MFENKRNATISTRLTMFLRHPVFRSRLDVDISAVNICCYRTARQRKSALSKRPFAVMRSTEWMKTHELSVDATRWVIEVTTIFVSYDYT